MQAICGLRKALLLTYQPLSPLRFPANTPNLLTQVHIQTHTGHPHEHD